MNKPGAQSAGALYRDASRAVAEYQHQKLAFDKAWRDFDGEEETAIFDRSVDAIEAACTRARTALEAAAAVDSKYGLQSKATARALPFIGHAQLHVLAALLQDVGNELVAVAPVEH